jgi:hypothetical protein
MQVILRCRASRTSWVGGYQAPNPRAPHVNYIVNLQDLFPRQVIGQEIDPDRSAQPRRQSWKAPEAPRGKRPWSGTEALPGARIKGDFSPTREIIPQPSVDRVLAGAGAPNLEKMSGKAPGIRPTPAPASPVALSAEPEGRRRDAEARDAIRRPPNVVFQVPGEGCRFPVAFQV